jgi:hypothetical protein
LKQDFQVSRIDDEMIKLTKEVRKETKEKLVNTKTLNLAENMKSILSKEISLTQAKVQELQEKET